MRVCPKRLGRRRRPETVRYGTVRDQTATATPRRGRREADVRFWMASGCPDRGRSLVWPSAGGRWALRAAVLPSVSMLEHVPAWPRRLSDVRWAFCSPRLATFSSSLPESRKPTRARRNARAPPDPIRRLEADRSVCLLVPSSLRAVSGPVCRCSSRSAPPGRSLAVRRSRAERSSPKPARARHASPTRPLVLCWNVLCLFRSCLTAGRAGLLLCWVCPSLLSLVLSSPPSCHRLPWSRSPHALVAMPLRPVTSHFPCVHHAPSRLFRGLSSACVTDPDALSLPGPCRSMMLS